jgi:lysophospholipase L1-like esterase
MSRIVILLTVITFLVIQVLGHNTDPPAKKHYEGVTDSLQHLYPFLHTDSNKITGSRQCMMPMLEKLNRIALGSREQVVIVHIGDSHIQPGKVTEPIRDLLQNLYGNAGRGLLFPYRVAKSNGPDAYTSRSDSPWNSCRIVSLKQPCPSGIAGFTLWSEDSLTAFRLELRSNVLYGKGENQLTIFHATCDTCLDFEVLDATDSLSFPVIKKGPESTSFLMLRQPSSLLIRTCRNNQQQRHAIFYALNLSSDEPGVIVHTIGVNGATFEDYLNTDGFFRQLASLQPDLLIFSLGTNEAISNRPVNADSLMTTLDRIRIRLVDNKINDCILFTSPPSVYKGYRKNRRTSYRPNPNAEIIRNTLAAYSESRGFPYWDWFNVMGGKTSMAKWKSKRMTDRRYIHFTNKGYTIQGVLLREAIRSILSPLPSHAD